MQSDSIPVEPSQAEAQSMYKVGNQVQCCYYSQFESADHDQGHGQNLQWKWVDGVIAWGGIILRL